VNLGWYALLAHWFDAALFFCFLPIVTMSRSDMIRPVPSREVLIMIGVVFAFVILIVACKWLIPASAGSAFERIIHHPGFVFPFWAFLIWSLYRVYRKQKDGADA
jgi:hypothetical protein